MYQYNTFAPLASSKSYVSSIRECSKILKKCVVITNGFRKTKNLEDLTIHDIESGQRLLNLSDESVQRFLGPSSPISTANLEKSTNPMQAKDGAE